MEIITVWGSSKNLGGRINMEQKLKHRKELVLSATFVGLVCGLVLTHQQAYAAQTLPVNNQESQITAVAAPENNLSKTAAVNQDYSAENISNSAASGNVTTSTYSSLNNNEIAKQETAVSDSTNAASTVNTSATVSATNGINTSSAAEKNQPVNTMTSSSNQDTNNTTVVNPAAVSDNQINGNSTNTAASSEQSDTNIIAQGIWGTSKWDYTHVDNDYILHLHAGTLGAPEKYNVSDLIGICSLNTSFSQQLTQIVIDPGVIANQNSCSLFKYLGNLKTIQGLENLDTSQVTDMSEMFEECYGLTSLDLSNWNTSNVTNMYSMFRNCFYNLTSLNLSKWNTSQVTNMYKMFSNCNDLTILDLSDWDTSKVTNTAGMFRYCRYLNHLVLGPKTKLNLSLELPAVPAAGTKIPGTDKAVTAPYWVATSGYQQGKRYTSDELEQLTGRDQVTTYDWDSQPLFASTVATKAVIRTINVHNPDGTMQTENQIATLTQEIKNNADGTQTLGPWSTGQWQAYAVPEITGYTAAPTEVAAQTVTDSTVNQTIDVYYEPVVQQITVNYLENGKIVGTQILTGYAGETIIPQYRAPKGYEIIDRPQGELTFSTDKQQIVQIPVQAQIIPTSESKVLIRTVNIHLPSGNLKTYRQSVVLTRTVYLNAVSGEKTYDDWSTGHWGAITVPVVAGYTASQAQVAAQTVTAQDSDQLLDIYYTKA